MHCNNWNEGVGGLGTELNLLNSQVRKNSLNIAQIVRSFSDPCHVITSVRSQPLFSFILQPERGYKYHWYLYVIKCLLLKLLAAILRVMKMFDEPLRELNTER